MSHKLTKITATIQCNKLTTTLTKLHPELAAAEHGIPSLPSHTFAAAKHCIPSLQGTKHSTESLTKSKWLCDVVRCKLSKRRLDQVTLRYSNM